MAKRRDTTWERLQLWLKYPVIMADLLREKDFEGAIGRACHAFNLDPTKQADRDFLLGALADIHFPEPRAAAVRGRKKEWTADRIARLRDHVAQVKSASLRTNLPADQTVIAEFMKYRWPNCWSGFVTDTLKRAIRAYARGFY
jgi:hypothetical protein